MVARSGKRRNRQENKTHMLIFILILTLLCMGLVLLRVILGPTTYDRVLATNVFGTLTVIFVVALSYWQDNLEFIDIAIIYGLINFITTIAFLKYIKQNSFKD